MIKSLEIVSELGPMEHRETVSVKLDSDGDLIIEDFLEGESVGSITIKAIYFKQIVKAVKDLSDIYSTLKKEVPKRDNKNKNKAD